MRKIVTRSDRRLNMLGRRRRILLTTALAVASALALTVAPQFAASQVDETVPEALSPAGSPDVTPDAGLQGQLGKVDCRNRFIVFEHVNFKGSFVCYAVGSKDMSRYGPSFNDKTSSFWNDTGSQWCAYEHKNYGGRAGIAQPYRGGNVIASMNDKISSIRKAPKPNRC
jgi:hypothetical protein